MSEQPWDDAVDVLDDVPDEPVEGDVEGASRPEPTGVERVDAVLDAVASLGDRPLEEHPAVFETAHHELRATLDS